MTEFVRGRAVEADAPVVPPPPVLPVDPATAVAQRPAAAGPHPDTPEPDDALCHDPDCECCYPGGLEEAQPTGEEVIRYAASIADLIPAEHRAVTQALIHGLIQDGWERPPAAGPYPDTPDPAQAGDGVLGRALLDRDGYVWPDKDNQATTGQGKGEGIWLSRDEIVQRYGPVREVLLVTPAAARVLDAAQRVAGLRTLGDATDWRLVAELHRELRAAVDALGGDHPAEPAGTTLTVPDSPKMLRETLCVAQGMIGAHDGDRVRGDVDRLGRLIAECDRHRPLGADGKHGDRHTPTCGCEPEPEDSHSLTDGARLSTGPAPEQCCTRRDGYECDIHPAPGSEPMPASVAADLAEPSKHPGAGPENRTNPDSGGSSRSSEPEPAPEPAVVQLAPGVHWLGEVVGGVTATEFEPAPEPDSGPGWDPNTILDAAHLLEPDGDFGALAARQIRALLADRDRRISPERYKAAMDDLARVAARADQELDAARAELAQAINSFLDATNRLTMQREDARRELAAVTAGRDRLRERLADSIDPATIPDQRAKGWADWHPEAYCHRCGRPNIWSWYADNAVWNEAEGDGNGILCPVCMVADHERVTGERTSWRLVPADKSDQVGHLIRSEAEMRHRLKVTSDALNEVRNELAAARRVGAADALDDAAAQWLCKTWLAEGLHDGGDDERAKLATWAAEIRERRRPVPGSPEPAGDGEEDGAP